MSYKVSNTARIKDNTNVVFKNIIATTREVIQPSVVNGYASGGSSSINAYDKNIIQKYPFSSDANSTDVGDLTQPKGGAYGGTSSENHGYPTGGHSNPPSTGIKLNEITRFPFAVDANATDVGDLTVARMNKANQQTTTYGYTSGGFESPTGNNNVIDKFLFSSTSNAIDVGNLTDTRTRGAGASSSTHGYTAGGHAPPLPAPAAKTIDKFPFSSDGNASDVGDLTLQRHAAAPQTSPTHGYASGGQNPSTGNGVNIIDRFAFAVDANASDVGDLLTPIFAASGSSSSTHGYTAGGDNSIQKFPFATNANSTDVGDLLAPQDLVTAEGHEG